MRTLTLLLVGTLLVAPLSHTSAQETTASGNLQTEASWSALKSLIDAANNQSKMAMIAVEAIQNCGSKGMLYGPKSPSKDASGCVPIINSSAVVQVKASSGATKGNGKFASYAKATCPAGTVLIACMGSRTPDFTDSCEEEKCGFVGAGPFNKNTCITTIDDDSGTRATAWATCLKTGQ